MLQTSESVFFSYDITDLMLGTWITPLPEIAWKIYMRVFHYGITI